MNLANDFPPIIFGVARVDLVYGEFCRTCIFSPFSLREEKTVENRHLEKCVGSKRVLQRIPVRFQQKVSIEMHMRNV